MGIEREDDLVVSVEPRNDGGASAKADRAAAASQSNQQAVSSKADIPSADLRLEASARAIAAVKRGKKPSDPEIDRVWTTYVGQANAGILAFIEEAATLEKSRGWHLSRPIGLERQVEEFKRRLPGWWFRVAECQVSADASCGPTRESPHIELIADDRRFDDGFHADLPQPATMAEALRVVMREALEVVKEHKTAKELSRRFVPTDDADGPTGCGDDLLPGAADDWREIAQAMSAGTAKTEGLGPKDASAVRQDAPETDRNPHQEDTTHDT